MPLADHGAPVGPTVDALVAALVAQKRGATVTPVDVTIDGFRGKQIDLMVPLAVKIAACDGGIVQVVDRHDRRATDITRALVSTTCSTSSM